MKLHYNSSLANHSEISSRMKSMTLAFESAESDEKQARLVDGKSTYCGDAEITKYLDELAGELHSWYYCNC